MRHLQVGRKLGVDSSHRIALLRSLTLALIEKEAIKTTKARAKELRWFADRMVTLAKRGDVHARRHMIKLLGSTETNVAGENRVRNAIEKVYTTYAARFKTRPGGYTQIMHLADRRAGDNAEMVLMRYIPDADEGKKPAKGKKDSADKLKKETKLAAPEDKPAKAKKAPKADKAEAKPKKETKEKA